MAKPAGYSGTPLPKKLGVKEGAKVGTVNAPAHFQALLEPWPEGAELAVADLSGASDGSYDVVVAFFVEAGDLAERFMQLKALIHDAGGLWVGWPKKASKVPTTITEDTVRGMALDTGKLVDNKVCAIDATWSGLRLVVRKEHRGTHSRARGGKR